jgi:hypothetical protein
MATEHTSESHLASPERYVYTEYFTRFMERKVDDPNNGWYSLRESAYAVMEKHRNDDRGEPGGLDYLAAEQAAGSYSYHYNQVMAAPGWERRRRQAEHWNNLTTTQKFEDLAGRLYGENYRRAFEEEALKWADRRRMPDELIMEVVIQRLQRLDGQYADNSRVGTTLYRLEGYDPMYAAHPGEYDWFVAEHFAQPAEANQPQRIGKLVFQPASGEPPIPATYLPRLPSHVTVAAVVGGVEPRAYQQPRQAAGS